MTHALTTTPLRAAARLLAVGAAALTLNSCAYDGIKVIVINMFQGEAQPFIDRYGLKEKVYISGLSPDAPNMLCNYDGICQVTTGMGYANAASTLSALLYRSKLDLTHTYFVIAGIAGIDPGQGTVGSAAWARYAVDYGLSHEIDAREMPAAWPYGYFGIGTRGPGEKPPMDYRTEVFQLNETLLQKAYTLSKPVTLEDSPEAIAFRKHYTYAPANQPPAVIQCDVASADTWWAGRNLGQRARLDEDHDRRQGHLLHHRAGGQRHAGSADARRPRRQGRFQPHRAAARRFGLRPPVRRPVRFRRPGQLRTAGRLRAGHAQSRQRRQAAAGRHRAALAAVGAGGASESTIAYITFRNI